MLLEGPFLGFGSIFVNVQLDYVDSVNVVHDD